LIKETKYILNVFLISSDPYFIMPGKLLVPVTPKSSKQAGIPSTLLYSGSRFQGHQKSKGNKYDVEVVLQVCIKTLHSLFL